MRWPWQRRAARVAEDTARAVREAEERLRRAQAQTDAIDARAAELARELPAGGLYLRLSWVFRQHEQGHD